MQQISKWGKDAAVVEVLPCAQPGWRAVLYIPDDNRTGKRRARKVKKWGTAVLAWYVVRDHHDGKPHLHPLVALNGEICDATEISNYMGVIGPDGSFDDIPDAIAHSIERLSAIAASANKMDCAPPQPAWTQPDDLARFAARESSS